MYEDIRQLIVENSIPEALEATDNLGPTGEFRTSLLLLQRRWRVLETQALNQSQHEHIMRVEENQVIEDLIALLDRMEVASHQAEIPTTELPPSPPQETATSASAPRPPAPQKAKPVVWVLGAALALLLAFSAYWISQKLSNNNPGKPTQAEVSERDPRRPAPAEESPGKEATNPADERGTPSITIDPSLAEKLQDRAVLDVDRPLTVNPDILKANLALFRGNEFMSAGKKVNAGLAFYYNKGSGATQYVDRITKEMSTYLTEKFRVTVSPDVLLSGFHTNSLRNTIMTRGDRSDARLSPQRANYLIMVDLRNVKLNRAELRVCLVDLSTQTAHNVRENVEVKTGSGFPGKDVLYTTTEVLREFANKKLWALKQ